MKVASADSGSTFAPLGLASTTGNVTVPVGATFQVQLLGATAGTEYDRLTTSGTVTLGGTLDVIPASGLSAGTSFLILNKTSPGAISGNFASKPEGSIFASGGYNWVISYIGGDGNDVTVTIATTQQSWRFTHFGTTANTGTAADTFDANGDGEKNLLEFATAQNPNAPTQTGASVLKNGAAMEFTYTRSKAAMAEGVTFAVEWSDTLTSGTWSNVGVTEQVLTENGTVQTVKASVASGSGRRFLHLKVSKP